MAFSFASWQQEVFLMWSRSYIHFPNGRAHRFAFLKPEVPSEWLHSDESMKGKSSRIHCLLCSKHGDRLRATKTLFLQGVRKLQWKKRRSCKEVQGWYAQEAVSHEQRPTSTVNEKITRSTKLWRVTSAARWRRLRIACQPIVRSRLSVHSEETPNNKFPECLEPERRHGVRLGQLYITHMSKFHEYDWETNQEIRRNSWMHQSRCDCMCLFAAQINKLFMPRDGILLSSWCSNRCAFHINLRPKKKNAIQYQDQVFANRWEKSF